MRPAPSACLVRLGISLTAVSLLVGSLSCAGGSAGPSPAEERACHDQLESLRTAANSAQRWLTLGRQMDAGPYRAALLGQAFDRALDSYSHGLETQETLPHCTGLNARLKRLSFLIEALSDLSGDSKQD